jgi:hypothetical protein
VSDAGRPTSLSPSPASFIDIRSGSLVTGGLYRGRFRGGGSSVVVVGGVDAEEGGVGNASVSSR